MKSKEEIEQLAIIDLYDRQKLGHYELADLKSRDYYYDGFTNGYTQCQEDMAAEIKKAYEQGLKDGHTSIPESYVPSFNSLNKQD